MNPQGRWRAKTRAGILTLTLGVLAACGPASRPVAAPAPPPAPAPPAPPANAVKMETMICRNSQDGRVVECGTPNAVMVGMKEN